MLKFLYKLIDSTVTKANANYSSTKSHFITKARTKASKINHLVVTVRDTDGSLAKLGDVTALTNGIVFRLVEAGATEAATEVKKDTLFGRNFHSSGDLLGLGGTFELINENGATVGARFEVDLAKHGNEIDVKAGLSFAAYVQDDVSGLLDLSFAVSQVDIPAEEA